jgi:hypothetical protein
MSPAVTLASSTANSAKRVVMEPAPSRPRRSHCAQRALAAALLALIATARSQASDLEASSAPPLVRDVEGGGYQVGESGLWLGGYATLNFEAPESEPLDLSLNDLGLLARYELTPSLAFFNETDLVDTVTLTEGEGVQRGSRVLLLERLYLEWAATSELSIRFGKFLTPFGIWNVIRRSPLTWTVDRPVATQSAFPDHTTGASLLYQTTRHGWSVDATAYGQAQDELVRGASDISASADGGARVVAAHALGSAYVAIGASAIGFKNVDTNRWENSEGADLDVTFLRTHLTGELAYTHVREPGASDEFSFYLQDVIPLYGSLFGVFRYEHIAPRRGPTVNGELVGLAWRVVPHVLLKADYQFADHEGSPSARSALERGFFAGVTFYY